MRLRRPGRGAVRRATRPLAALVLAAATPAWAAAARGAAVWTVDKAASRISFRADAGGRSFDGVFKRWEARLTLDPAHLPGSRLSLSVEAASAVTGEPARDAVLPGPAWMAAGRFPSIAFVSRSFADAEPGRYRVSGDLTVRGVTRPLAVTLTAQTVRDRIELAGAFPVDRAAFGVGPAADDAPVQVSVRLSARRTR